MIFQSQMQQLRLIFFRIIIPEHEPHSRPRGIHLKIIRVFQTPYPAVLSSFRLKQLPPQLLLLPMPMLPGTPRRLSVLPCRRVFILCPVFSLQHRLVFHRYSAQGSLPALLPDFPPALSQTLQSGPYLPSH